MRDVLEVVADVVKTIDVGSYVALDGPAAFGLRQDLQQHRKGMHVLTLTRIDVVTVLDEQREHLEVGEHVRQLRRDVDLLPAEIILHLIILDPCEERLVVPQVMRGLVTLHQEHEVDVLLLLQLGHQQDLVGFDGLVVEDQAHPQEVQQLRFVVLRDGRLIGVLDCHLGGHQELLLEEQQRFVVLVHLTAT